ncbi:GIY-YIG nuclease family protein [Micromonospora purpureochromogenes]|uniref:GIY-YIG nuclease family protein n=1 Tax=Micromonospora purpureochromogenes TaxID=47872 RepID=UPI0033DB06B8
MTDIAYGDLLAGFTPALPYTMDTAESAPRAAGVHVVLAGDTVIYVGRTRNLRDRLRQHLTGNRGSSVLHDQIGQELDRTGPVATASDIAHWLNRCVVRWKQTENSEAEKEALVLALTPRFNRQVPRPRPAAGQNG